MEIRNNTIMGMATIITTNLVCILGGWHAPQKCSAVSEVLLIPYLSQSYTTRLSNEVTYSAPQSLKPQTLNSQTIKLYKPKP